MVRRSRHFRWGKATVILALATVSITSIGAWKWRLCWTASNGKRQRFFNRDWLPGRCSRHTRCTCCLDSNMGSVFYDHWTVS
ncbi:hypothetical protein PF005_g29954 [Phytophthora fragariae]|uniref:Uncharacterized protein n=2 Tax=Phytophthora TaxID=4783 RepID=A0A6A3QE08_9STRA|nr:hypothetical protein PF009_g29455 [Phytophthora fragariae]KAE8983654.1 hypothetical protein PR002_g23190 [Phytophthora rubi]KAE9074640.1 hypothetical protein PF006_g28499 [Phytophthora fragariae]KAE9164610.1 hypothetical protein PF005_g29954 [Phytophthora fragariae]KAE9170280.1 hypothetical protein PF004_g27928 [Phytophthora fragariae]